MAAQLSHRPYYTALDHSTLCPLMHIHSLSLLALRAEESITQLRYRLNSNSKYNTSLKVLPVLLCTKNTALVYVSQDKYSIWLHLVLYLSVDMPPRAVFSVQTRAVL